MVGGTVALLVQTILYPVRARDPPLRQVANMQQAIAAGVDSPVKVNLQDAKLNSRFAHAKDKAETALLAAEAFLPFCLSEPRLKGSFRALEPIYQEIIYVLHQIIDRMDNVVQLRKAYGSSVLEDLNPQVYAHRRNVAATVTLTLFAVNEALVTRLPLPQFLPSSRLAQLRLVYRVREVLAEQSPRRGVNASTATTTSSSSGIGTGGRTTASVSLDAQTIQSVTTHKFLSWNAAAAGQMEIIEFLEELVDLAKLLVGVNAFRSGMLERPSYREYVRRIRTRQLLATEQGRQQPLELVRIESAKTRPSLHLRRRRVTVADGEHRQGPGTRGIHETRPMDGFGIEVRQTPEDLPASLQRVGVRLRQERNIARRMTMLEGKGKEVDLGSS